MKSIVLRGLSVALSTALLAGTAQADTTALQRCRIVAEAAARLACYDAIALPGIGSRAGWGAPVPGAAPAAAAGVPPVSAEGVAPTSGFGLPAARTGADQLESRVVGLVEAFPKGTKYRLENGQVWEITETAMGFYQLNSPKVTISRGVLGNFVMQIEGVAAAPKVKRVQ